MRELFSMWRNTRMVVLVAVSASAYVAVLLPFKGFVIIPGLTEVRPGAAIPVVLSFLLGPAAAWGAAFGNLIADALGGMLSPGSLFGFIGNFFYGFVPYALWRAFMGYRNPVHSGPDGWFLLLLIIAINALVIGSFIGWGADMLRLAPFAALGLIIAANNFIASAAIATILLALLYPRVESWGLLYYQVMEDEIGPLPDVSPTAMQGISLEDPSGPGRSRKAAKIAALGLIAGAVLAFASGLYVSGVSLQAGYGVAAFSSQTAGSLAVTVNMLPGLILILICSAFL